MDQLLEMLDKMPASKLVELKQEIDKAPLEKWIPNEGPQSAAYNCTADQVLYGGSAGGGKSQILLGKATQKHKRSLILRRMNVEVDGLVDDCEKILGNRDGYQGQKHRWYLPEGRLVQFGGCQHPGDEKKYKGQAKDFIGVDEATEFLESQILYVINWLRSADPNQLVQLMLATNPPSTAEGEWVARWFAPWVDPSHPLFGSVKPGELLWFVLDGDTYHFFRSPAEATEYMEGMPSPPRLHDGSLPKPQSRTFIRSELADNPDYIRTDYGSRLAQMPEVLRKRYMDGDFTAGAQDDEWQVIPTEWIIAAQMRWKDTNGKIPRGEAMTCLALDVAQGGADKTVVAMRFGFWFAPLVAVPGTETPKNSDSAALVVKHRIDRSAVVVDVGGGYGGGVCEALEGNNILAIRFNGAKKTNARTKDKSLGFVNKRAEAIWGLREALDPSQPGGSPLCLPDSGTLRADLAGYRWRLTPRGVQIEDKEEMKKRIGRSPDEGDAVVMCWSEGQRAIKRGLIGAGATSNSRSDRPAFASMRGGPLSRRTSNQSARDE